MLFVYCATFLQLVAESFPVSSSGHLALLEQSWLKFLAHLSEYHISFPWSEASFWERYVDFLHVVPLIVIAVYFYSRWRIFLLHPLRTWRSAVKLMSFVVLADGVTAVLYFSRAQFSFFTLPLWIGFSATALLLLSLRIVPARDVRLTWSRSILLGLFQGLALVPGVSRFAATFCGARYLGFSSRSSFELSFMLQWPLILAAVMRSILFFSTHPVEGVVTPLLLVVFCFSAFFGVVGFYYAARLAYSERLWLCSFYVLAVALLAGIVAY